MNAIYMQQYLQQLQMMNFAKNIKSQKEESENESVAAETEVKTEVKMEYKAPHLSFGIDAILSDSFGKSTENCGSAGDSAGSSRSSSPTTTTATGLPESYLEMYSSALTPYAGHKIAPMVQASKPKKTSNSRARTIFSDEQLEKLEDKFQQNQYLIGDDRIKLAATLGLNVKQVKIWFQNRRIKHRRATNSRSVDAESNISDSD